MYSVKPWLSRAMCCRAERVIMVLLNLLFGKPQKRIDVASLNRDLEILNDCAELIESTVNPEVFFARYDLYMEKLSILSDAQSVRLVKVKGDDLVAKYKEMNTEEKRISTINEFIDRFWKSTCIKADNLKTEKGKNNRYQKFLDSLSEYNEKMPRECIEYYTYLFYKAPRSSTINRRAIPAEQIDSMQRIEASEWYKNKIYKKYYSDYPEKPYISQDRELNTDWISQADMFPVQSIIPISMMQRYTDGLLPGHVYMLYWLGKYTNKKIPAYFEYKYGVDFCKEKGFLRTNGFLDDFDKPTDKGKQAISRHKNIIDNHSPKKVDMTPENIKKQTLAQKDNLRKNGFAYYEYIASKSSCPICKALDGKIFPISQLEPGVNAPPMCDKCRCSIAAHEDRKEYESWINFLNNGGTTAEWKKLKKKKK